MNIIIAFRKKFKNITLVPFLEHFGREHKFETRFDNFPRNIYPKVIFMSFYFYVFIRQLIE
jgi:hypothetical protein